VPLPETLTGSQIVNVVSEHKHTPMFDTLAAELTAFAAAIRNRGPHPIPLADILHGVAVFEAVVGSAATGKPVAVK
jgi:predicted dehydrogenase